MDRKILIDLAIKAGRKRQSKETGFIHYCFENPNSEHTIPLFDNFCFALALFRSRTSENVLEGKVLLEKLLNFQVRNNFPVYLHQYPECKSSFLGSRVKYILEIILSEFHHVIGAECKQILEKALSDLHNAEEKSFKAPRTSEEWGEALSFSKAAEIEAIKYWHSQLHTYVGSVQNYEKKEPAVTLFDLYMGQLYNSFSKRALQDHPIHLRAALLSPKMKLAPVENDSMICTNNTLFWGGKELLYSLYIHPKKSDVVREKENFSFSFSDIIPEEGEDRHEIAFFLSAHEDTELFVNGKKATTFQLGDQVELVTGSNRIQLIFSIEEGEGAFFGQISFGNRPCQLSNVNENQYAAYDWQITLRTLWRTPKLVLRVNFLGALQSGTIDGNSHGMHAVVDVECRTGDC